MANTDYTSFRRLSHFWDKLKTYIADRISEAVHPSETKEVVPVLTYGTTAPASASEGDYYINSSSNKLYEYVSSEWTEDEPSEKVIYVTSDTSHIYLWNGSLFVDATGEAVDNVIYVNDLETELDDVTTSGVYSVCQSISSAVGANTKWYSLIVVNGWKRVGTGAYRRKTFTRQVLSDANHWQEREKIGNGDWEDWAIHTYAYTEEVMPLIYAGL